MFQRDRLPYLLLLLLPDWAHKSRSTPAGTRTTVPFVFYVNRTRERWGRDWNFSGDICDTSSLWYLKAESPADGRLYIKQRVRCENDTAANWSTGDTRFDRSSAKASQSSRTKTFEGWFQRAPALKLQSIIIGHFCRLSDSRHLNVVLLPLIVSQMSTIIYHS